MSVELPFAPVDGIIRRNADGLRVSAEATAALAEHIENHGAELAITAAERADADGRKTIMAMDFNLESLPGKDDVELPIAPVDRIARHRIDDRYRVSMDARIALAAILEEFADRAGRAAAILARHANRRTVTESDIETHFELDRGE